MKINCILTIPCTPPPQHLLHEKMTQGNGAKIAIYTTAAPAIAWGLGEGGYML